MRHFATRLGAHAQVAMLVLAVALGLAACGGGGSGEPGEPGVATVDRNGGTVTAGDGAQVLIPPEAFAEPLTVRISKDSTGAPPLPPALMAAGPVYAITPHGGDFSRHVEVTIPLPDAPAADNEQYVLVTAEAGSDRWTVLSGATPVGNALRVPVLHFSYFRIVTLVDMRAPTMVLVMDRVASVPVPGTTQISADHEFAYSDDAFERPGFNVEARLTPAPPLRMLRGSTAPAPRYCQPAALGPAGARLTVFGNGAPMAPGLGHWPMQAAASSVWPRSRTAAAPEGFIDTALTGGWTLRSGPGVAHFWGQDQPRAGAWVDLGSVSAPPAAPDRYTLPPAGNAGVDDEWTWYGKFDFNAAHNGRIRIEAAVSTDCGFDVAAVPFAFRLNVTRTGNAFFRLVEPTAGDWYNVLEAPVDKTVHAGENVELVFSNLHPDSVWDRRDEAQEWLKEVISLEWETSSDGVNWRTAPALAPSVTVDTRFDASYDDPFATSSDWRDHTVLRLWRMRFNGVMPGLSGWYRAYACVRLSRDDPAVSGSDRTLFAVQCGGGRAYRLNVILDPPTVTRQPVGQTVMVGETASLSVAVQGTPSPNVQWQKRTVADAFLQRPWTDIVGATSATYTTPPLTLDDHPTFYRVAYFNASGGGFTDVATVSVVAQLTPPSIVAQPGSLNVNVGGTAVFAATVAGSGPLSYQWRRNGVDIAGANAPLLTLSNVTAANDGNYALVVTNRVGSVTSEPAALVVTLGTPVALPPSIASPPVALAVPAGSAANFAVAVTGTGPYSYVWTREGTAQPVGSEPILAFASVQPGDAGRYQVRVTNTVGTVLSAYAELAVGPGSQGPVAPSITTPPAAVAAFPGSPARFVVAASGSGPLSYQWRRDGVDIAGATGAVLSIDAVTGNDAGQYAVEVRNGAGTALSAAAPLVVIGAPVITRQPQPATVVEGGSATFDLAVSGDAARFQWLRNGVGIAGATAGTYRTPALTPADHGAVYSVIVYNGAGLVFSNAAVVTVTTSTPGMAILAGDFVAGGGGGSGDGIGTAARFDTPEGLAVDAAGHLYVASSNAGRVTKIDAGAVATTIALQSFATNLAWSKASADLWSAAQSCGLARLSPPLVAGTLNTPITVNGCTGVDTRGIAVDPDGLVYLALQDGNAILRLQPGALPNTMDATVFVGAENRFVAPGAIDGTGTGARFNGPRGMAFGPDGHLYVADSSNHTIRRVTPQGVVSTFAGSAGNYGLSDANGTQARFFTPTDLAFDSAGNLVVLQRGDPANPQAYVRRITPAGDVSTLFHATAEVLALAQPGQEGFAASIKGLALLDDRRVALSAGNAILVRTLP